MRNRKNRYIYRIETAKHHGWRVVFTRPKLYTRFFSDSAHGGSRKALLKAHRHRDRRLPSVRKALRRLLKNRASYTKGPHAQDVRSKTGVPGVRYMVSYRYHYTKNGERLGPYPHECYIATFGGRGNQHFASFGIRKYGRARAYAMARRARRRGMAGLSMRK